MRLILSLFFLTLVLDAAPTYAAPTTKTTLTPSPLNAQPDPVLGDKILGHDKLPSHEINLAVGFAGGNFLENDVWKQGSLISLRYSPLSLDSLPTWDYQAELNEKNLMGLFVGKRWYLTEDDYHPYVRLAAGSFFDASSEFANIVAIKRWRLRTSLGVGEKFNLEVGFGLAVTGPDMFAQFGYNFYF